MCFMVHAQERAQNGASVLQSLRPQAASQHQRHDIYDGRAGMPRWCGLLS